MVESIFEAEALDRYYRAELLFALGRHAEALDWYRTIAERATYELVYVAPARWRQAWLYPQAGRPGAGGRRLSHGRPPLGERRPPLRETAAEAARRARAND